jgi:hypothetical protein
VASGLSGGYLVHRRQIELDVSGKSHDAFELRRWRVLRQGEPGPSMLARLEFAILLGVTFAISLPGQVDEYHVKAFFLYILV